MQTIGAIGMRRFGQAIFAAGLALGYADAASARNASVSFALHNAFGTAISLQAASCSPAAAIAPPVTIAAGRTGTFGTATAGGTLLCTVRYQGGAGGCQFQVQVNAVGRTTTGFASANAYAVASRGPSCGGHGTTAPGQESGTFTMR